MKKFLSLFVLVFFIGVSSAEAENLFSFGKKKKDVKEEPKKAVLADKGKKELSKSELEKKKKEIQSAFEESQSLERNTQETPQDEEGGRLETGPNLPTIERVVQAPQNPNRSIAAASVPRAPQAPSTSYPKPTVNPAQTLKPQAVPVNPNRRD